MEHKKLSSLGGSARWKGVPKEARSKIMKKVSKARKAIAKNTTKTKKAPAPKSKKELL